METLGEIFRSNGFIEKSAVWAAGGTPVQWTTYKRIQLRSILGLIDEDTRTTSVSCLRSIVPARIIFACVLNCDDAARQTPGQYYNNWQYLCVDYLVSAN